MNFSPRKQQGAVLIVALVMLLIITLLAVSSTRESALETRMTANFVSQQRQFNFTEATLREGEQQMTSATIKPREPNSDANGKCADGAIYCFHDDAATYAHNFGDCTTASTTGVKSALLPDSAYDGSATEPPQMRWYSIPAPSGATEGASENPEYGNMMLGKGTFRYEINGVARDDDTDTCTVLRSTTAKVFN